MEKIIANAPCALQFPYSHSIFSRKGWMLVRNIQRSYKKKQRTFLNLYGERCNKLPMMSFIQSGSETGIYRIFGDNKVDGIYVGQLSQHNSLISFHDDAEIFLLNFLIYVQVASTDIYIIYGYPKLYTKKSKPSKLPTKSKARSLRTSLQLRTLGLYTNSLKQLFLQLYL